MEDRNEVFARECRDVFIVLVNFLARAVLRSEGSERGIVARLRGIGFPALEPMNLPEFPISSLTVLSAGICMYLLLVTIVFSYANGGPDRSGIQLMIPSKIALARIATVIMTIWLIQRFTFFRRSAGEPMRYHAYLLAGIIAGVTAAAVCVAFHFGTASLTLDDVPVIALSALLCAAVALCCDDSPEEPMRPVRLRLIEALGCGAAMAAGTALLYAVRAMPVAGGMSGWVLAAWITLPTAMAMMIGGFVPHIYRRARLAAAARHDDAITQPAPRISRHAMSGRGANDTAGNANDAAGKSGWAGLRRRGGRDAPGSPAKAA